MDLSIEYENALKTLTDLQDQVKGIERLVDNIRDVYRKKQNALADKEREAIRKAQANKDIKLSLIHAQQVPLNEITKKYQRILKLMHLYKSNPTKDTLDDPLKIIYDDAHNIFALKIAQAGKYSRTTVNKFSLYLEGRSIFREFINHSEFNFYGGLLIHRAPSEKALIEYISRPQNIKKIIGMMIPMDKLFTLEKEYQEAIELLKDVKWQIKYLESRKYYYEENVSRGTEDPEYAKILKQIKLIKNQKALS